MYLNIDAPLDMLNQYRGTIVDTKRLGEAALTGYPFDSRDGGNLIISTDYFGAARSVNPVAGAIENISPARRIKVWPNLAK